MEDQAQLSEIEKELSQGNKGTISKIFVTLAFFITIIISLLSFIHLGTKVGFSELFSYRVIIFTFAMKQVLPVITVILFVLDKKWGWILAAFYSIFLSLFLALILTSTILTWFKQVPILRIVFTFETAIMLALLVSAVLLITKPLLIRFKISRPLMIKVFLTAILAAILYKLSLPMLLKRVL